jgi:hypothetical protein
VADAGLLITGTTMARLGYRPGRKLSALVHTLVTGGECIDDVALRRPERDWAVHLVTNTGRVLNDRDVAGCGSLRSGTSASSTRSPRTMSNPPITARRPPSNCRAVTSSTAPD